MNITPTEAIIEAVLREILEEVDEYTDLEALAFDGTRRLMEALDARLP